MKATAMIAAALSTLGHAALAQTQTLSGMLGHEALVIVDGGAPILLAASKPFQGVRTVSTPSRQAVLEQRY